MSLLSRLSPEIVTRTWQVVEAIAIHLGVLPPYPKAHDPTMPTVTTSIGTDSRDYSTITAWEADLDNAGLYGSGDGALGEMYADAVFAEMPTIDGGGTVGLSAITLRPATGEQHDGTRGSGTTLRPTGTGYALTANNTITLTIDLLEVNADPTTGGTFTGGFTLAGSGDKNIRRFLCYDNSSTNRLVVSGSDGNINVSNGFAFAWDHDFTNFAGSLTIGDTVRVQNCSGLVTATNKNGWNGGGFTSVTLIAQNCVSCGASGTGADFAGNWDTVDHNASSDTSATGTGSLTEIAAADQFVSTVGGSEDLHLKAGADCIDTGTDLGTTPTDVNIDIDGRDRDAEGDTWDIGADELVGAAAAASFAFLKYYMGGDLV